MSAHEAAGYGARQLGYGQSPAILVVDFQRAFTDPAFELGRFEHVHRAVERTARLLAVARELGVPVIKCFTSYESLRDVPPWKVDAMYRDFFISYRAKSSFHIIQRRLPTKSRTFSCTMFLITAMCNGRKMKIMRSYWL